MYSTQPESSQEMGAVSTKFAEKLKEQLTPTSKKLKLMAPLLSSECWKLMDIEATLENTKWRFNAKLVTKDGGTEATQQDEQYFKEVLQSTLKKLKSEKQDFEFYDMASVTIENTLSDNLGYEVVQYIINKIDTSFGVPTTGRDSEHVKFLNAEPQSVDMRVAFHVIDGESKTESQNLACRSQRLDSEKLRNSFTHFPIKKFADKDDVDSADSHSWLLSEAVIPACSMTQTVRADTSLAPVSAAVKPAGRPILTKQEQLSNSTDDLYKFLSGQFHVGETNIQESTLNAIKTIQVKFDELYARAMVDEQGYLKEEKDLSSQAKEELLKVTLNTLKKDGEQDIIQSVTRFIEQASKPDFMPVSAGENSGTLLTTPFLELLSRECQDEIKNMPDRS